MILVQSLSDTLVFLALFIVDSIRDLTRDYVLCLCLSQSVRLALLFVLFNVWVFLSEGFEIVLPLVGRLACVHLYPRGRASSIKISFRFESAPVFACLFLLVPCL